MECITELKQMDFIEDYNIIILHYIAHSIIQTNQNKCFWIFYISYVLQTNWPKRTLTSKMGSDTENSSC